MSKQNNTKTATCLETFKPTRPIDTGHGYNVYEEGVFTSYGSKTRERDDGVVEYFDEVSKTWKVFG